MSKEVILVLSGISGFFGLISTLAYFQLLYATNRAVTAEQSLAKLIEGEGLFDAAGVIKILREFKNEQLRFETLKEFLKVQTHSQEMANRIYDKIKANIDINAITKESGHQRRYTALVGALVFVGLAVLGFLYAIWPPVPSPQPPTAKLSIERIRSFDPSQKIGAPGDWSVPELKPENVISAKNAEDFLLPLGFVVRNFVRKPDGEMKLTYRIIGLGSDGQEVWSTPRTLTHVDDWKGFGAAKSPGIEKALVALGNPEAPGEKTLPMIPYMQCAKPAQLRDWFGRLEIEVVDGLSDGARARESYSVQFQKDKLDLGESRVCK